MSLSFVRLEQRREEKERNIPGLTLLQIKDPLCGSVSLKAPKRPHKRISCKLAQVLRVRGRPKTGVEVSFSSLLVFFYLFDPGFPSFSRLLSCTYLISVSSSSSPPSSMSLNKHSAFDFLLLCFSTLAVVYHALPGLQRLFPRE